MLSELQIDQGLELPETLRAHDPVIGLADAQCRLSLRAKAADRTKIAKAAGLTLPAAIGQTAEKDGVITACLGPDEWMIFGPAAQGAALLDALMAQSTDFTISVTDISHRNVRLTVKGSEARGTINVGCPLDLSLTAFPIGKCCRSVFEAAPILLHRTAEDEFHIECWRSFAPYVAALAERHIVGLQAADA